MEGQEKRLLLAIGISFLFLFAWYTWFIPAAPPAVPTGSTATPTPAAAPEPVSIPAAAVMTAPAGQAAGKPAIVPAIAATEERTIKVETPFYTALLSNRGGVIRSIALAHFREKQGDPATRVELVRGAADASEPALAAELSGMAGPLGFSGALFDVDGRDLVLKTGEKGALVFRHRTAEGLELAKTLTFDGNGYTVLVRSEVINRGNAPLAARLALSWGPGLEPPAGKDTGGSAGAQYSLGGKLETLKAKKLTAPLDLPLPSWIGSHDAYFLAAMLPLSGYDGGEAALGRDGRIKVGLRSTLKLAPGTAAAAEARLYVGPKEMDTLGKADPALTDAIDLGWFSVIAKPLLWLLNWLYGFLGNYGLAIIVLSVVLKLLFLPANNASFRSMRKMAALQPRINALRDRYRKDSQKLNAEIMGLYKENKVNPAGGCLPIIIQIPVFIALYRVLSAAIELRHAPFALWITDLSAKDPYYVTPILMGATMFIQQKMTPTAGDPKQAQIMLFLPVIFTAMFVSLPSGLVLYWLVTNLLSIAHQWYMLKSESGE
jgi:YidC/Oxa1 family membrane protein insertase